MYRRCISEISIPLNWGEECMPSGSPTLRAFPCRSEDVCRIEDGSTNPYLKEPRIIEDFLTEVEPYYNASVANLRSDTIEHRTVFVISGFIAYVQTCSPAGARIFTEPLRSSLETTAQMADARGLIPLSPAQTRREIPDHTRC